LVVPSQRGPTEYHDASGGYGRVATVIPSSLTTGLSPAEDKIFKELAQTGLLSPVSQLGSNPYPAPRAADHPPVPFTGAYPRIQADPPYATRR
jgi:hypothetical protein